ncbi:MAG: CaiB/BaiF CoA-transferase family protein [Myxococcota bacterium]|jgi:alpha-methylacyl-CoA racemase
MASRGFLDAVTVLDLSTVGPGTRCTRILADYGARVVKVGAPPRRQGVQVEPHAWAYSARRGWESVRIDLKAEAGREAFLALARNADVVLESYRPGVVDRLGIGYEAVREVNPRIVYCSTSGYGQTGPAARTVGHDINYLAVGGYLHTSERGPGGKPPIPGATVADSAAGGMQAAIAILAALHDRERSGSGSFLDVSVAEGVLTLTSLYIDDHLATGAQPGPGHDVLTGRYAFYDTYACSDGGWVAVGAIEAHFYRNLCEKLGCEQWQEHQYDDAAQDAIRSDFREAFLRRDRDAWVAELAAADTCVSPVYSIEELVADPHFVARGAFGEAVDSEGKRFRQVAPVMAGMQRGSEPARVREASKTDTDALLAEAGYGADQIEKLKEDGVIA